MGRRIRHALGELFWGSLRPLDRRLLPFGQGRCPVSRCRCPIPRRRRPVPGRGPAVTRRLLSFGGRLDPILGCPHPILCRACPVLSRRSTILRGQRPLGGRDLPIDEQLLHGQALTGANARRRPSLVPLGHRLVPRRRCLVPRDRHLVPRDRHLVPRRRRPVPVAVGKLPVDRHLVPRLGNVVPRMGLGVALAGSRIALLGQVVASGRLLVSPVGCLFTVRGRSGRWHRVTPSLRPVWRASSSTTILPADGLPAMHMDIEDRLYPPVRLATIAARPEAASVPGTGPASCVTPRQVRPAGPRVTKVSAEQAKKREDATVPTDRHGG
jgi:hypothetical protein